MSTTPVNSIIVAFFTAAWKGGLLAEIDSKLDSLENKLKELSERFLYAENIRTAVSDETGGIRIVKEPSLFNNCLRSIVILIFIFS